MKFHHRNYAFRPPYRQKDRKAGKLNLLARFMRAYLGPYRGTIVLCILLAALDYCGSFYLLAYFNKVVVDSILVVVPGENKSISQQAAAAVHRLTDREPTSLERERRQEDTPRPKVQTGLDRRLDAGIRIAWRPPDAGRQLGIIFILYITPL